MTHVLDERLRELAEDVDWKKALKDVTAKERGKAAEAAEKKAQSSEKARLLAEQKVVELEGRLEGAELKLAEANSLNLDKADQILDLKIALGAYENKWYNEGFANAKKSAKPVIHQARLRGFGKGWLAALQVMGMAKDSPLRDPSQIPYPASPPSS